MTSEKLHVRGSHLIGLTLNTSGIIQAALMSFYTYVFEVGIQPRSRTRSSTAHVIAKVFLTYA
jgi:hypothetical protein